LREQFHKVTGKLANSYIFERGDELLVFDAGYRDERFIMGYIHRHLPRAHVALAMATHSDVDHSGGLNALARAAHCKIAVFEKSDQGFSIDNLADAGTKLVTSIQEMLRPRFWRMYASGERKERKRDLPRFETARPSMPADLLRVRHDFELKDGELLPGFPEWRLIWTPGHSEDSCCFYHETDGILVTGDTILGSSTTDTAVLPSVYSNKNRLQESIRRLKELRVTTLAPGHGKLLHGEGILEII